MKRKRDHPLHTRGLRSERFLLAQQFVDLLHMCLLVLHNYIYSVSFTRQPTAVILVLQENSKHKNVNLSDWKCVTCFTPTLNLSNSCKFAHPCFLVKISCVFGCFVKGSV